MSADVLVFDDQDLSQVSSYNIKQLMNHIPSQANVKGGFTQLNPILVIFVSNDEMPMHWDDASRSRFSPHGNRGWTLKWTNPIVDGVATLPSDWPFDLQGDGVAPGLPFPVPVESSSDFRDRVKAAHVRGKHASSYVPAPADPPEGVAEVAEPIKKKQKVVTFLDSPSDSGEDELFPPQLESQPDFTEAIECDRCGDVDFFDNMIDVNENELGDGPPGLCCDSCVERFHRSLSPGIPSSRSAFVLDESFVRQRSGPKSKKVASRGNISDDE